MIEPPLRLFQVQVERVVGEAVELRQAPFGKAPEAFDAVDVLCAADKFVRRMIEPIMLRIADIHQAVGPTPGVGVHDALKGDAPRDGLAERRAPHVGNDLGVDVTIALVDAEDDGLATRPTPRNPRTRRGPK